MAINLDETNMKTKYEENDDDRKYMNSIGKGDSEHPALHPKSQPTRRPIKVESKKNPKAQALIHRIAKIGQGRSHHTGKIYNND